MDENIVEIDDSSIHEENQTPDNLEISDSDNEDVQQSVDPPTQDTFVQILNQLPTKTLPNINVPEKIVICFDSCIEINPSNDDSSLSAEAQQRIDTLKEVFSLFLHSKLAINNKTEFALMILKESEPEWIINFTSDIDTLILALKYLNRDTCDKNEFDISQLFTMLYNKIDLPIVTPDYKIIAPENVIRMIVMYNRSSCVPKLLNTQIYELLKEYPYLMVDILYNHEKNCNNFKCEEIYSSLHDLDNGYSYMFEASNCEKKLKEIGAKLLAHPLQRPPQKFASYEINKI